MTEKILKLLQSKDEGDNIIGLILFKKEKKATNKKLCTYIYLKLKWPENYLLCQKYFYNPDVPIKVQMAYRWKSKIKKL